MNIVTGSSGGLGEEVYKAFKDKGLPVLGIDLKKSDFTKSKLEEVFIKLFEKSKKIKYWLISYNSKSTPNKEEMTKIIQKYKNNIIFKEYELKNNNGGMGLKKGSKEYLILCY